MQIKLTHLDIVLLLADLADRTGEFHMSPLVIVLLDAGADPDKWVSERRKSVNELVDVLEYHKTLC